MESEWILSLADPRASLETVSGKGASLRRLAESGLPVPGGFHITTRAYRRFVEANGLQAGIDEALAGVDAARPATLEAASAQIGRLFARAAIPGDLACAIVQAYAGVPGQDPPVAVRSSATAEDLPEASFAGQQETYLNLRGAVQVLAAMQKCWASLWTGRAIYYTSINDNAGIYQRQHRRERTWISPSSAAPGSCWWACWSAWCGLRRRRLRRSRSRTHRNLRKISRVVMCSFYPGGGCAIHTLGYSKDESVICLKKRGSYLRGIFWTGRQGINPQERSDEEKTQYDSV